MKRILITGANSYIGDSFREYLAGEGGGYQADVIDTIGLKPDASMFRSYDVVFNVAGIVHIKETDENRHLYYDVNRDMVTAIAKEAKAAGVKQFIMLSTMSVYGITAGHITKKTVPAPVNAYGRSKLEADEAIGRMSDDSFRVACVRPPMVYGKGCKGNYRLLRKAALKMPFFADRDNARSMVYIENLCEFVRGLIDNESAGLFFPQNAEYVRTAEMVRLIAASHGRKIGMTGAFNWAIKGLLGMSNRLIEKVFGDLTYEKTDLIDHVSFEESIRRTEQ